MGNGTLYMGILIAVCVYLSIEGRDDTNAFARAEFEMG